MEAIARALEKTAQAKRPTQKNAAYLGSRSGLHRAVFFMSSESVTKFAQLYTLIANRKWGLAIGMFLSFSAMEQTISWLLRDAGSDDDGEALERYLWGLPGAMFGSVPMIGAGVEQAGSLLSQAITGKNKKIYSGTGTLIIDPANYTRTIINTVKAINGEKEMSERDWHYLARSITQGSAALIGPASGSASKGLSSVGSLALILAGAGNLAKPILDRAYPKKPAKKKTTRSRRPPAI